MNESWRRLSRKHHPDLHARDPKAHRQALEKQKQINNARDILKKGVDSNPHVMPPRSNSNPGSTNTQSKPTNSQSTNQNGLRAALTKLLVELGSPTQPRTGTCSRLTQEDHMDELGFDFNNSIAWFEHQQDQPYVLVRLNAQQAAQLTTDISVSMRRCYIADHLLTTRAAETGLPQAEILASKLPDPGSTMAGDFGEILCYFYQSTKELPAFAIGPKKWRLKQDRTKPAPQSDVVHFLMPNRPNSSAQDAVLCAEVKLKSTTGPATPIASAIEDCAKDRTSRLAATLVWLRERAMTENLGDVDIPLLDRFIHMVDHPPASLRFRAVAVICESLSAMELQAAPDTQDPNFTLVVIVVPNLKQTYEAIFRASRATVPG